jgi:hypothetical protein
MSGILNRTSRGLRSHTIHVARPSGRALSLLATSPCAVRGPCLSKGYYVRCHQPRLCIVAPDQDRAVDQKSRWSGSDATIPILQLILQAFQSC